jgi:hypothetical protein
MPNPKEFYDLLTVYGSKLSVKLNGVEDFPDWENALIRKARGLMALPVLEGTEAEIGDQLFDMIDLALLKFMISSVAASLRADI